MKKKCIAGRLKIRYDVSDVNNLSRADKDQGPVLVIVILPAIGYGTLLTLLQENRIKMIADRFGDFLFGPGTFRNIQYADQWMES